MHRTGPAGGVRSAAGIASRDAAGIASGDRDPRHSLDLCPGGDERRQQGEGSLGVARLHRPPDCVAARGTGRPRLHVAQWAVTTSPGGIGEAALIGSVAMRERIHRHAGHPDRNGPLPVLGKTLFRCTPTSPNRSGTRPSMPAGALRRPALHVKAPAERRLTRRRRPAPPAPRPQAWRTPCSGGPPRSCR